ncbi:hypothetical protein [Streptomyces aureus]|uniref:hypothetical protein n=1 Tax=Streptomyces aureus TaxID=193461 RepID=UPI0006E320CC|nr:hypothetical protein [Streptomyces aureus]
MSTESPPPPALIRIPVRIVVLVAVLPVRMVWDALVAAAHFLDRAVLRPAGRGLAYVLTGLNQGLTRVLTGVGRGLGWLFHHLVARPVRWLHRTLLAPAGRGLAAGARLLGKLLFVWPWAGLWRYLLVPVARYGIAAPARWLHRTVLRPTGRGLARALAAVGAGLGWFLPRLGRGLGTGAGWLARAVFVWPWTGLWRYVVVPVCRYGIAAPAFWLYRRGLVPLGDGLFLLLEKGVFVPVSALFRYVLVPLLRYGVVVPVLWFDRHVLTPAGKGLGWLFPRLGRGIAVATVLLARAVFVWPWAGLWRYVLVPLVRYGIVVPLGWLWNRVLVTVAREVRDALALCWRVAGYVSRAVGRAVKWTVRTLVGLPLVWFWRSVCTPVGHWIRDHVWAPARRAAAAAGLLAAAAARAAATAGRVAKETLAGAGHAAREALGSARAAVREARRDTWRALVGSVRSSGSGEPEVARARTLGSTTNVPGAAPAPEISLRKRG